jgi:hypothetical protein
VLLVIPPAGWVALLFLLNIWLSIASVVLLGALELRRAARPRPDHVRRADHPAARATQLGVSRGDRGRPRMSLTRRFRTGRRIFVIARLSQCDECWKSSSNRHIETAPRRALSADRLPSTGAGSSEGGLGIRVFIGVVQIGRQRQTAGQDAATPNRS